MCPSVHLQANTPSELAKCQLGVSLYSKRGSVLNLHLQRASSTGWHHASCLSLLCTDELLEVCRNLFSKSTTRPGMRICVPIAFRRDLRGRERQMWLPSSRETNAQEQLLTVINYDARALG